MAREHCAAQSSSPRCAPTYRWRATSDPAREVARLAASLRIAVTRVAQLQRTLQHQRRKGQSDQYNHGDQPPQPEAASLPRPSATGRFEAAKVAMNARQKRSARRAANWRQQKRNSNPLESTLSPPQPPASCEMLAGASPVFNESISTADSTATTDDSRQQTVSGVRETPQPSDSQLQPTQQPMSQPPQQPVSPVPAVQPRSPLSPPVTATAISRRPEPTGNGKRRAVENPPSLPPPNLSPAYLAQSIYSTDITAATSVATPSFIAAPSCAIPRRPNRRRDSRRSTPYDKPA